MNEEAINQEQESTAPTIRVRVDNTDYVIGMYFKPTSKETLKDKVRKLARKEIQKENVS